MIEFGYEEDFQEPAKSESQLDAIRPHVLDCLWSGLGWTLSLDEIIYNNTWETDSNESSIV